MEKKNIGTFTSDWRPPHVFGLRIGITKISENLDFCLMSLTVFAP